MRPAFRSCLAFMLLVCLVRTLLPEAWVLALHRHGHTTELTAAQRPKGKLLLSPRHTHCQTEQFYQVPFQAPVPVAVPLPQRQPRYQPLAILAEQADAAVARPLQTLRGPPTRA